MAVACSYQGAQGHSRVPGGVQIEAWRLSHHINPGVGHVLGGGFHRTRIDSLDKIFQEGLRPGGGGDRINTSLVLFAPWDRRSMGIVKFNHVPDISVYIYLTSESLSDFGARLSAEGHIMVQQTIPLSAFDAMWYTDPTDGGFYRMMVRGGQDQVVCSVEGTKKIATNQLVRRTD